MSAEQQRRVISEKVESTLQFLWNHHEVSLEHQFAFADAGCTDLKKFKGVAMRTDLQLSPTSIAKRVQLANIIAAWHAAWERMDAENKTKAESRAAGTHMPASHLEFSAMAAAYKMTVLDGEKLDTKERPSKSYIGRKMEQIEEGELETESLEDVTSKWDGEEQDILHESLDHAGKRRLTRKSKRVPLPKDVQELQTRHKVMAHCLGYLKTKQLSVGWLQTTSPKLWEKVCFLPYRR